MDPGLSAGQPRGAGNGRPGQQRLFRCSLIQGEQSAAPHTRHLNRLARSCRQVAQSIPLLWVIHEFAGASTGWAAPQWGGTMIPLRCRAAPLREPPSQRVKPAGCPTEARLLQRCRRRVGHRCICRGERPPAPEPGRPGKRNGLPAPAAGQMAKFRKASTKRLAQTAGTMFCREFG